MKAPKCTSSKHAYSARYSTVEKVGLPGTPLELFPSAMPQMHPRCQVSTHHRQWETDTCWSPQHVLPRSVSTAWDGSGMLIHCMDDGRISTNDVLYGQLSTGVRNVGVPHSAVKGSKQTWPQSMRNLSKQLDRCCVWSCLLEMESERSTRKNRRERSPESWGARLPQKQLHHVFL